MHEDKFTPRTRALIWIGGVLLPWTAIALTIPVLIHISTPLLANLLEALQ